MRDFTGRRTTGWLTAVAFLAIVACGDDPVSPAAESAPPATEAGQQIRFEYTVTLLSIRADNDCDDEGFPTTIVDNDTEGEFAYRFMIGWPNGESTTVASTPFFPKHNEGKGLLRLGTGTALAVGPSGRGITHTRYFTSERQAALLITFGATEWDSRIEDWYADEDMGDLEHTSTVVKRTSAGGATVEISLGVSRCKLTAVLHLRVAPVGA